MERTAPTTWCYSLNCSHKARFSYMLERRDWAEDEYLNIIMKEYSLHGIGPEGTKSNIIP